MEITEQKALTQARLMNLIKTKGDDFFTKVASGNKVIHLAYEDTAGFLSFMVAGKDKTYVFIHEKLSDKQREAELRLILEGKGLYYFSSAEINKMNKLSEQQERKKLSYKSINYDDVNIIMENTILREYREIVEFAEKLNEFLNREYDGSWNDNSKLLYMFKLGVMQGKREERARRKKS